MKLFESIGIKIVIVDLINFENLYTLKLTSINKIPLKNITLNSEN